LVVGLSVAQVLEVLDPAGLIAVPHGPDFLRGLAFWRDRVVPVVDLAVRLGLPPLVGERERLVVARANIAGDLVAFPVRPAIQTIRLPTPHRPCTLAISPGLALGSFELTDRVVVIPDLAAVALCA
jgi:chemotaxis signal transduction protein